jgi:peptidoglycan/xylan/chitin deacetylase (PgdA/CDA1 family)
MRSWALSKMITKGLARTGEASKLSVLIYHRVHAHGFLVPTDITADQFAWQMALIRDYFNPVSLSEAIERLQVGALEPGSVCITFDDGYEDNLLVALPLLKQFDIPATFFIATDFIDGNLMWNDYVWESVRQTKNSALDLHQIGLTHYHFNSSLERRQVGNQIIQAIKYLPPTQRLQMAKHIAEIANCHHTQGLMMNSEQLAMLNRSGMHIGAHTQSHPILASLTQQAARVEIKASKDILERILGESVDLFAYPNGKPEQDYTARDVQLVREAGFKAAVSTQWGVNRKQTDVYQIRRFTPWDKTPGKFLLRLWKNLMHQERA